MIRKTNKFLRDNNHIIVVKSDKSKKTVIMNRTDYEEKMNALISDQGTYEEINTYPTNKFEKDVSDLADR